MKLALAIVLCGIATSPARADNPTPVDGVWLSLPSIDGATGAEVGAETFLPSRRLGLAVTLGARKTAAGDYTGVAGGLGVEARWYWRGRALFSHHAPQAAIGWFVGGRADAALSHTHDDVDDRDLGNTLSLGAEALVGYRIAPWRGLQLTGDLGAGLTNEHDLAGRLPPWTMGSITVGLEVGWMF